VSLAYQPMTMVELAGHLSRQPDEKIRWKHVWEFLEEYRIAEPSALCLVSGLDVDEAALGDTPAHWQGSQHGSTAFPQEIFFLLCGSALGDVFGWATQQDGRIMHDVLPIKGHEHYELGSNSLQHLSWHTEDAFHPCRGDYVALMCLKNPDQVETVVCDAADHPAVLTAWELPGQSTVADRDRLFESIWTVEPGAVRDAARACAQVAQQLGHPEGAALLYDLADEPAAPPVELVQATSLLNRVVAYVDQWA